MHVTEFETVVKDPYIEIPDFEHFKDREVKVIIFDLKKNKNLEKKFNPKEFFGLGNSSKNEIEAYLQKSKDEWNNHL